MAELLTIAQAATVLCVSPRTVYRLIADRELRVVMVRSSRRIRAEECERYARSRERLA